MEVLLLTGDVAQWLLVSQNSNPKTLGSILWRSRVRNNFSVPPSQLLCRHCMCRNPPPPLHTHGTQICMHVKDPISICHKRVGLTASGTETRKHCTQEKKKKSWVAPYYGCLLSLGKAACISCALHWDKKVMLSNLIKSTEQLCWLTNYSVQYITKVFVSVISFICWLICLLPLLLTLTDINYYGTNLNRTEFFPHKF